MAGSVEGYRVKRNQQRIRTHLIYNKELIGSEASEGSPGWKRCIDPSSFYLRPKVISFAAFSGRFHPEFPPSGC